MSSTDGAQARKAAARSRRHARRQAEREAETAATNALLAGVEPVRVARDEVVTEMRAEAGQGRKTRGLKVVSHYQELHRRGGLSDPERTAADRYALTCEAEAGARDRSEAGVHVRPAPWEQGHPGMTQVQAAAVLRQAHVAVGPDATSLLRLYVRDNLSAEEIAIRRRENDRVLRGRIRAALTRLAEWWRL